MRNIAFIPVRGGSKSIPLKNIKNISGKPLVYWVTKAACECHLIDRVYVSTDSDLIREVVEGFADNIRMFDKVEVIERTPESSTDTASTELAMLEFADQYTFDNIVLIQATSPLLESKDLEKGFRLLEEKGTDSVMSVVRQYRFNWQYDGSKNIVPTNYDVYNRPRRQDFHGYLVENGAFYITSRERLIETHNRVSGNIKAVEMDSDTYLEIDEPKDWDIIEILMDKRKKKSYDSLSSIKIFLTDVDGCLTDGGMYYSENGDELKKFNTKDGKGIELLREKGIKTGIVTSESVGLNVRRASKMKMDIVEIGCGDKLAVLKKIACKYDVGLESVAYMGDDVNDIEILKSVGFSCCPSDAQQEVKNIVDYVATKRGGDGAIREIANMILNNIRQHII